MTEETKKSLVARVAQANRSELVVLLYEIMDGSLEDAKEILQQDGSKEDFRKNIAMFRGALNELMGSLDYRYPVSYDLLSVYSWADREAASALATGSCENLDKLRHVMEVLKKGFEEVAKQDESPAVMEHAETIYAGLTYGKGSLNETVGLGDENRGYRV